MSAADPFSREYDHSLSNPASRCISITPADEPLAITLKSLRVYNGGTEVAFVRVVTVGADDDTDGDTVTLPFPPGLWVEALRIKQVSATGTSGTLTIHGYTD